jgi:hypothetical protein
MISAQDSGFGLGVILGEPTGLSLKAWIAGSAAIDAAAAWSLRGRSSLHLHADYLQHNFDLFKVQKGKLPFYYGIGGRIRFVDDDDARVGFRIPVGIDYLFANAPLDVFLEVVPLVDLVPDTDVDVNGGAGIRYFFR